MGMAAGQARLLSITSRLSDNELRAQIINNNKMRLATESAQASDAYIAALNQAQLMFTNYDADNNTSYQRLTYNALTSFNPYNNQYALINSAGNVLISEKDAENYKASGGDLEKFLGQYGLEYTTTYFNQFDEKEAVEVKYNTTNGPVDKSYSREELIEAYEGYIDANNFDAINQYEADLAEYYEKKANYDSEVYHKRESVWKEINDAYESKIKTSIDANDLKKAIKGVNDKTMKTDFSLEDDSYITIGKNDDDPWKFNDNIVETIDKNNLYYVKDSSGKIYLVKSENGPTGVEYEDESGNTQYRYPKAKILGTFTVYNGDKYSFTSKDEGTINTFYKTFDGKWSNDTSKGFTLELPNGVDSDGNELFITINVSAIYGENDGHPANDVKYSRPLDKKAKEEYMQNVYNQLKNFVYSLSGKDLGIEEPKEPCVDDKKYNDSDNELIKKKIALDTVFDIYGEPQMAWIDTSLPTDSYNNNGEAKAQWYTNLFNRIKSGGYAVIMDGMASSADWIQFAFESGIVSMEQVDTYDSWQPLIYSNCSDITSQTNEQKIAIAEAEYTAAMNRIENKDKRYDLELKNIDTEHNSLQTEYESIKSAIEKNIERTFKFYS